VTWGGGVSIEADNERSKKKKKKKKKETKKKKKKKKKKKIFFLKSRAGKRRASGSRNSCFGPYQKKGGSRTPNNSWDACRPETSKKGPLGGLGKFLSLRLGSGVTPPSRRPWREITQGYPYGDYTFKDYRGGTTTCFVGGGKEEICRRGWPLWGKDCAEDVEAVMNWEPKRGKGNGGVI